MLILDDLHWIDPISAELLLFISTIVTTVPVLFIMAQRRQGADLPNERLIRLESLLTEQSLQIMLQRLEPDDSITIIQDLLGTSDYPEELAQLITVRSEGNPYFIEEFVRMFMERGYIKPVNNHWEFDTDFQPQNLTLPLSLEALLRARIDALPDTLNTILQSAAIVGREFDAMIVEQVAAVSDIHLNLERLASRLLIRPVPSTDRWQFSHALIESVVYKTMLHRQRRQLHAQVAQFLELRWASNKEEHAADLAYHYVHANDPQQAIPYLLLDGERAAAKYANEEAVSQFQQATTMINVYLESPPDWQLRALTGLGSVYRLTGRYDEAIEAFQSALTLMQNCETGRLQIADIYYHLGKTSEAKGNYEPAKAYYQQAIDTLGEPETEAEELVAVRLYSGLAWPYFAQGDLDTARQYCEQAKQWAKANDSIVDLATVENLLGGIYFRLGEWRNALNHTTRALVLREQMGYTWGVASALNNLGILAIVAGHWQKARGFFLRSLNLRQEIGDVEGVAITHNNLANLLKDQGELEAAQNHFLECQQLATEYEMSYHLATAYDGLAQVYLLKTDIEQARTTIDNGLSLANELGLRGLIPDLHRIKAEILLAQNNKVAALEQAQRAVKSAQEASNQSYEAAGWRIAATICLAIGDLKRAERCLKKANDLLTQTTHELEVAFVAVQMGQWHRASGDETAALANYRRAKHIFTRLGTRLYLAQLEELMRQVVRSTNGSSPA